MPPWPSFRVLLLSPFPKRHWFLPAGVGIYWIAEVSKLYSQIFTFLGFWTQNFQVCQLNKKGKHPRTLTTRWWFHIYLFLPLGKWSNLTSFFFQMGWNHHLNQHLGNDFKFQICSVQTTGLKMCVCVFSFRSLSFSDTWVPRVKGDVVFFGCWNYISSNDMWSYQWCNS